MYRLTLRRLDPQASDGSGEDSWTVAQIVEHVASPWYAEQVGDLRLAH